MSILKTEAFVLKSLKYGETSKIVSLFTRDFGKINGIVKGARNFKSKLCGTLETMNYVNVVVYFKQNKELQLITNAEYKKSFKNIVTDFGKLETAYKLIEIVNKSVTEHDRNNLIFELILNTYSKLNEVDSNVYSFILFFQIQLSKILGLCPDFLNKGEDYETFFNNNGFYADMSEVSSLISFSEIGIDEIEYSNISNASLNKFIGFYEKYLSSHTSGYSHYKSTRVFKELNYNI